MDIRRSKSRTAAEPRSKRKSSRGGRPSLEDSGRIADRILAAATELFLADGYGATSIEEVARAARVSKRTFYARFPDKAALFGAVLHGIIESLKPRDEIGLDEGEDLESILRHLAGLILRAALTPRAIAVHRLIVGESARFPALAAAVNRNAASEEAVTLVTAILQREMRAGTIALDDPQFAARHFLQMVMNIPVRAAMGLQRPMSDAELRLWPARVTAFFLSGCGRPAKARAIKPPGRSRRR